MTITLRIHPRRLRTGLLVIAVTLAVTSFALALVARATPLARTKPLERLGLRLLRNFDAAGERSIPTAWGIGLLLGIAGLAALTARLHLRRRLDHVGAWSLFSALFLLFAVDDYLSVHEQVAVPLRQMIGSTAPGLFHYAWVIPALLVGVVAILSFRGFAGLLPASTKRQFIAAGVLLLGSAIGLEMVLGMFSPAKQAGAGVTDKDVLFLLVANVRQGLKLVSESLLLVVVLEYLFTLTGRVDIALTHVGPAADPGPYKDPLAEEGEHGGTGDNTGDDERDNTGDDASRTVTPPALPQDTIRRR